MKRIMVIGSVFPTEDEAKRIDASEDYEIEEVNNGRYSGH